tara:strand:+ start:220 stop:555 length:336 start_codon:yes stop_codon:yes gene_type:complete
MQGIIWESMHFEEIALVMTLYGRDTTESEAMDAYENCILLGYPRGGNPNAFPLVDRNGEFTYTLEEPNLFEIERNGISSKWWTGGKLLIELPYFCRKSPSLQWMFVKEGDK